MPVSAIRHPDVRADSLAMKAAVPDAASRRREGARDRFIAVSRTREKLLARKPVMFARLRAVNVTSYQDVIRRLKAVDNVPPGPMAPVLRHALVERLVKDGVKIFPHLITAIKDSDKVVRMRAADMLGRIFQGAGAAKTWKGVVCRLVVMPTLKQALKDPDADVRNEAAAALRKLTTVKAAKLPSIDKSNPFQIEQ